MTARKKMSPKQAGKKGGETAARNQGKGRASERSDRTNREPMDTQGQGSMRGIDDIDVL